MQTSSALALLGTRPGTAPKARTLLLIGDLTPVGGFEPLAQAAEALARVHVHFPSNSRTVIARDAAGPGAYASHGPEQFT